MSERDGLRTALLHAVEFIEDWAVDSEGMDPAAVDVVTEARTALTGALSDDGALGVDRLTAQLDLHWMEWNIAKSVTCSCGGWQFDTDRDIVVGEHFAPFSRHVAEAVLRREARQSGGQEG